MWAASQYFDDDDFDNSLKDHLIKLASEVCRGKERGLTLSPPRNSFNEQDNTAEMDLVSKDSYHAAEDDLLTAYISQRTRSQE